MRARSKLLSGAGAAQGDLSPAGKRRKKAPTPRLSSIERRQQLLTEATRFFAEYGLTAQTRALAQACGVAQRLLYRYFPSKAELLDNVYREAILSPFQAVWFAELRNRSIPFQERLLTFYRNYYKSVLSRTWIRLFLYASLAEAHMAPDYISQIIFELLETIVREAAHEQGVDLPAAPAMLHEVGWTLHGAISHLAIRRHLYSASQAISEEDILALHVRGFLSGFAGIVDEARRVDAARHPGPKKSARTA